MLSTKEGSTSLSTCTSSGSSQKTTSGTESSVNTLDQITENDVTGKSVKRSIETLKPSEDTLQSEGKKVKLALLENLQSAIETSKSEHAKKINMAKMEQIKRMDDIEFADLENCHEPVETRQECDNPVVDEEKSNYSKEKTNLKKRLLRYCVEHKITNQMLLHKRPYNETEDFFLHPQYNSVIGTIFNVVSGQLCYEPFKPFIHHKRLKTKELKKGDGKIYKYLKEVQKWDDKKISSFARDVVAVINKRSGKKNCLWLQGVSNAGKSQIIGSLLNAYFPNTMGTPNNSPRTTFTFNDCMYKRVILWEEPNITIDNIEDIKIILGGQDCRIDAKYQSSAVMQATPFFITSNKPLWALTQNNKPELLNRVHWYKMDHVSPTDNPFPFRKWDWDIFFTENFDSVKYDINKYGH